jgi:DNA (cytosine-5)-methyltransferase 1
MKPRLLDLCSGAGGAAVGYDAAGFDVVGVDLHPQPRYPFKFFQADALNVFDELIRHPEIEFDAIHASPPCQPDSAMSSCRPGLAETYERLIVPLREALQATGLPYVIENVVGAALVEPAMLCGRMFGRDLYRHRLFETNFDLPQPEHPEHLIPASKAGHWTPGTVMSVAGHVAPIAHARLIMEIDWTTREELVEAIPPYFTEYVGRYLLAAVEQRRAA